MPWFLENIASVCNGQFAKRTEDVPITHLLIDSRNLIFPENTLFFAINGETHNGHRYIEELASKRVAGFVIQEQAYIDRFPDLNFILVDDVVKALQQLTAAHRSAFDVPVIGITGSNGKTIVKEWLYQLLSSDYNIIRSPKSYNSQVGVPLSVWPMSSRHELGIFEAGISRPGEMENLEKIIQPGIGVITNTGPAHDEGFESRAQKVAEKCKLFAHAQTVIYCLDQALTHQHLANFECTKFTWSRKQRADLLIGPVKPSGHLTEIAATYDGQEISINIPFADDASIENAIHCWAVLLHLGIAPAIIKERMMALKNIAMRLELKDAINNCSLINDSYNNDLESLRIALDFQNHQQQHPKQTLILSDILQSGMEEAALYQAVAGLLRQKRVDRLIGIGPAISRQQGLFRDLPGMAVAFYPDTGAFLREFSPAAFQRETILLKGARDFRFEQIGRRLEQKAHQTVLEINLDAISHNLKVFRSLLPAEVKLMAMVKAFSYGSGSFEIANLLQFNRVDYLAVAYADEGVELRKAGISLPIMVMNPDAASFEAIIRYRLEPEIYSLQLLQQFQQALSGLAQASPFPVHIKLDTGMHRLGFEAPDLAQLIRELTNTQSLRVQSVFSHLAGSDDLKHRSFTQSQIEQFQQMSRQLLDALDYPVMRHILNSAGIAAYPEAHFDMVRLGIGMYGIDTSGRLQQKLRPVSRLISTVSQVKTVAAGKSIGYDRKGEGGKVIATVGIGYADGLSRLLSNGIGHMFIKGLPAPIVGNVCMDMCMVDVSNIPGVEAGDEVLVFGEELPVEELAKWMQTIPYEVLTNISQRVKRIYYKE